MEFQSRRPFYVDKKKGGNKKLSADCKFGKPLYLI